MFSSFMLNAWTVGTIVAITAGFIGFFVVIRGAAFAAHTLPMGAFPGAAAAALLGINPYIGVLVFAALGVVGIGHLSRRGRPEVGTALCLVMLLGLGALFLSMTREYSQEVFSLLFGEVLGASKNDILLVAVASAVAVATTLVLFRPLLLSSVFPQMAEAAGVSRNRMEIWFLSALALAAAVALPVVGALLVFSLMVGPAAVARSLADRPFQAALLSVAVALVVVWAAIALSYVTDWPIGFFVGGISALAYGLARAWPSLPMAFKRNGWRKMARRTSPSSIPGIAQPMARSTPRTLPPP